MARFAIACPVCGKYAEARTGFFAKKKIECSCGNIINVKVDSDQIKSILAKKGYYPAFHMNKKCWVSIILEDALTDEEIESRIRDSYESL